MKSSSNVRSYLSTSFFLLLSLAACSGGGTSIPGLELPVELKPALEPNFPVTPFAPQNVQSAIIDVKGGVGSIPAPSNPYAYTYGGIPGSVLIRKFGGYGKLEMLKFDNAVDCQVQPEKCSVAANFQESTITPDLGDNPLTISSDTTILFNPTAANQLYWDSSGIRRTDASGNKANTPSFTGLKVEANVTLTFEPDDDNNVLVALSNDLHNQGLIFTRERFKPNDSTSTFMVNNYIGDIGSRIQSKTIVTVLCGIATCNEQIGDRNGGHLSFLVTHFINKGDIFSSPTDTILRFNGLPTNSDAGNITITATQLIENIGNLNSAGMSADPNAVILPTVPGNGGNISLLSSQGNIHNSGDITANGGSNSSTDVSDLIDSPAGGFPGSIRMIAGTISKTDTNPSTGNIVNLGNLTAIAGDGIGETTAVLLDSPDAGENAEILTVLKGRPGGNIELTNAGLLLLSAGDISTDGTSFSSTVSSCGVNFCELQTGDGGNIEFTSKIGINEVDGLVYPHIRISGNLVTNAGVAQQDFNDIVRQHGGKGGDLTLDLFADGQYLPSRHLPLKEFPSSSITLVGIDSIDISGANGTLPSRGSIVDVLTTGGVIGGENSTLVPGPAGELISEAAIIGVGGKVHDSFEEIFTGARGGTVSMTRIADDSGTKGQTLIINGNLDVSGGEASNGPEAAVIGTDPDTGADIREPNGVFGGDGGNIVLENTVDIINNATLISKGGLAQQGTGGNGGNISALNSGTQFTNVNNGVIDVTQGGGAAEGLAGTVSGF